VISLAEYQAEQQNHSIVTNKSTQRTEEKSNSNIVSNNTSKTNGLTPSPLQATKFKSNRFHQTNRPKSEQRIFSKRKLMYVKKEIA